MLYAMRSWRQGWDLVIGGEAIPLLGAVSYGRFSRGSQEQSRDLCVGSQALLEAMAVLHGQEQNNQCSPSQLAHSPGALGACRTSLQEQSRCLATVLCLDIRGSTEEREL